MTSTATATGNAACPLPSTAQFPAGDLVASYSKPLPLPVYQSYQRARVQFGDGETVWSAPAGFLLLPHLLPKRAHRSYQIDTWTQRLHAADRPYWTSRARPLDEVFARVARHAGTEGGWRTREPGCGVNFYIVDDVPLVITLSGVPSDPAEPYELYQTKTGVFFYVYLVPPAVTFAPTARAKRK